MLTLLAGYHVSNWYFHLHPEKDGMQIGEILAAVIFFLMAGRLLLKGLSRERILERLEQKFEILKFVRMVLYTGVYTLLSGIAFGFMGTSVSLILWMILMLTLLAVVAGTYTGYFMGDIIRSGAYLAGALLLGGVGVDVVLRYILEIL